MGSGGSRVLWSSGVTGHAYHAECVVDAVSDRLMSASVLAGECVPGFPSGCPLDRYHGDQTPWVL